MNRVWLALPSRDDPAHNRVARCLAREYRRFGWRVRVWTSDAERKPPVRTGDFVHLLYFCKRWKLHPDLPVGCRVLLTHQGASLSLLEDPADFAVLAARADGVSAVSRAGLGEFAKAYPEFASKAGFVHNGADRPDAEAVKRRRPYLLSIGRIAAYKGLDLMAMAFAGLARDLPDLDWVALGPDQMNGRFHRFVARLGLRGRVLLPGAVSHGRAAAWLRGCAAFVSPSRLEGSPMALLEALAARKPVAAARAGGIPELVRSGKSGFLFAPGDANGAERAVRRALRLRPSGGFAFSWRRAAKKYKDWFEGMTAVTD